MTLIPMYEICPKCGKKFSFNPDVGKFTCPRCGHIYWMPVSENERKRWLKRVIRSNSMKRHGLF